ncbi:Hypothetical predicted protein [Mytilus galloprovincialis]|uniref:Uncharacterized protein n=1 Tax=Mytilus galloprovincialis TaxID=29158 RepID=A0A8B6DJG0_MYTGA|nr:Hypothetical predicted protein [Mytilus galloprovincialis]
MATVVDRDEIQAILSKTWNGAMSTAAITAEFFTMMYEEACQNSAPYKHIEESLKFYCPDFEVPKKWSNITRYASSQMKKGHCHTKIFDNEQKNRISIGYYCNKIGLTKDGLNGSINSNDLNLSVGAFREMCLFKNSDGRSWKDVKDWLLLFKFTNISLQKICYCYKKIQKKFTELSKEGNKCHAEELLSTDLASYLNKTVNNKQSKQCNREYQCHRKTEKKLLIQNIKLQKEVIAYNKENDILNDLLHEDRTKTKQLTRKLLRIKCNQKENRILKQKLTDSNKKLKSIKHENFYKRIKRRESKFQRKENKVFKKLEFVREKNDNMKVAKRNLEEKINKLENSKKETVKDLKHKLHCKANEICYLRSAYKRKTDELQKQKVDYENQKQKNITLNKQNIELLQLNQENEKSIETKTEKGRYTDDMRTCILELASLEIPCNKVSAVVNSVGKNLFNVEINAPSKTTVQNIISEGNVISHQHVAHELAQSKHWGAFSDGTSRDGKKIVDIGVHTEKQTYCLGYIPVAVENAETLSNVVQNTITETAKL